MEDDGTFPLLLCSRDDFHQESNFDVLVTIAPNMNYSLFDLVHMEDELKQIFGREVDLVEKNLSPDLYS